MKITKISSLVLSRLFVLTPFVLPVTQGAFAGYYENLNYEEQSQVNNGSQVVKSEDVPGKPWPQYTVYQKVSATPEESAAVFADFDLHQEFFTGITRSQVFQVQAGGVVSVNYSISMLGQKDETSIEEHLGKKGPTFTDFWRLNMPSKLAERSDGSAFFEPLGSETLLVYTSLMVPKSSIPNFILSWFKGQVATQLKKATGSLVNRIQDLKVNRPDLLKVEEGKLQNLLQQ